MKKSLKGLEKAIDEKIDNIDMDYRLKSVKTVNASIEFIENLLKYEYDKIRKKISKIDIIEQDLLHIIEFENFNAAEGYKLTKMLKKIRNNRREWKNSLCYISSIRKRISKSLEILKDGKQNINQIDKSIKKAHYKMKEINKGKIIV